MDNNRLLFDSIWNCFEICEGEFSNRFFRKLLTKYPKCVKYLPKYMSLSKQTYKTLVCLLAGFFVLDGLIAIYNEETPILRLVLLSLLLTANFGCLIGVLFVLNVQGLRRILQWCEKKSISKDFASCSKSSEILFKRILSLVVSLFVSAYVGQSVINSAWNNKWTLAIPIPLFFYPVTDFRSYFVNFLVQITTAITIALAVAGFIGSLVVCVQFEMTEIALITKETKKIEPETASSKIQEVVKRHIVLIEFQSQVQLLTAPMLLAYDLASIGCFLVLWITFIIAKQEYTVGISCSGFWFIYIGIIYLNEMKTQKLMDLGEACFDLDWVNMTPRNRRWTSFIMIFMNRPIQLKVGPFCAATLEHVYFLVNRSIAYCLFFDKLLRKITGEASNFD